MEHIKEIINRFMEDWEYCEGCEHYIRKDIKFKCKGEKNEN